MRLGGGSERARDRVLRTYRVEIGCGSKAGMMMGPKVLLSGQARDFHV